MLSGVGEGLESILFGRGNCEARHVGSGRQEPN